MATLHDDEDQSTHAQEHVEVEDDKPEVAEVEVLEDERPNASNDDDADDEEERPQRHKETAAERRERAKKAKLRDKHELDQQRRVILAQEARLAQLEQGQNVSRVTELDNRIATALNEVDTMDKVKAAAISKNNGADAVQADNLRNQAAQRANDAIAEKNRLVAEANRPKVQAPSYEPLAREFMDANPWYNHTGDDEDSLIVKAIDTSVAKQFNPNDPAYWSELQRRIAKRLPQHFEQDDQVADREEPAPRTRKGPPVGGSSRSNSSTSTSTQIRLSPERVQAMKEAGKWDDPADRAKMAKIYAKYDKESRS